MDAQQNVYNLNYDCAVLFASQGIVDDGDIVTEKLSIGCDATSRTSPGGTGLLGPEGGLNYHNVSPSPTYNRTLYPKSSLHTKLTPALS